MNRATDRLPPTIDPWRLPAALLTGTVTLSALPRLAPLLLNPRQQATFSLHGTVDDNGIRLLRCRISAVLQLSCQRCLEPFDLVVELTPELAPVASEAEMDRLPERYEPLLCDGPLAPVDLLEDELLLALPQVPRHPDQADCGPLWQQAEADTAADSSSAEDDPQTHKPFAALSSLLKGE